MKLVNYVLFYVIVNHGTALSLQGVA